METLIVHAENKAELKVVKDILKALKIRIEESPYNTVFTNKIKQGRKIIMFHKIIDISWRKNFRVYSRVNVYHIYRKVVFLAGNNTAHMKLCGPSK